MKITLCNFRCYENETFDFGENGIVLISGPSGIGKSTLMLAINFVLFDTGTKLVTIGKTSCSVTMEFDSMIITRSKKPNRLVITDNGNQYEDDAAQGIINKKFGNVFETTGYISQNARDSFVLMSPIEKLSFLEKFAFQDIDLVELKQKCKNLISERNDNLLKVTSKLEASVEILEDMTEPTKIEFPLKCGKNTQEKVIKNENIRYINTQTLIKRCHKKINQLSEELNSLNICNAKINEKNETISKIAEKILKLSIERDSIGYKGDKILEEYESRFSFLINRRELSILENKHNEDAKVLSDMKEKELNEKQRKITEIEENIWKEFNKDTINDDISNHLEMIKDIEKIGDIMKKLELNKFDAEEYDKKSDIRKNTEINLENNKKLLEKIKMCEKLYHCPGCKIALKFCDNGLQTIVLDEIPREAIDINSVRRDIIKFVKNIDELDKDILKLNTKRHLCEQLTAEYKTIIDSYEDKSDMLNKDQLITLKKDLEYMINYRSSQIVLARQLEKLRESTFSQTILSMDASLKRQYSKMDTLRKLCDKDIAVLYTEDTLRDIITTEKRNRDKLSYVNKMIDSLKKDQEAEDKNIQLIKNKHQELYSIRDIDTTKCTIEKSLNELKDLEQQELFHKNNIENIEKYLQYEKEHESYDSCVKKINVLRDEEIISRKQYSAATMLKDKITKAESIAMSNIISSINAHTQPYMDCFFQDNPISVRLVPFKETKKGSSVHTKPQINLQIEYKGMESDINSLSGGELSRVVLAFALALGEMFNTPLMLLDECTSSLDQDLNNIVMDGIKSNFNGKIVLVIAHQCIEGSYDKVIKLT